jgi:hypothetical protein
VDSDLAELNHAIISAVVMERAAAAKRFQARDEYQRLEEAHFRARQNREACETRLRELLRERAEDPTLTGMEMYAEHTGDGSIAPAYHDSRPGGPYADSVIADPVKHGFGRYTASGKWVPDTPDVSLRQNP